MHFELIDLFKMHLYEKPNFLTVDRNVETTPSKSNPYNFDRTSPFYINITHRRKPKVTVQHESPVVADEISMPKNLFELTESNLREFSYQTPTQQQNNSRLSMVDNWRMKISKLQSKRESNLHDIQETLNSINETMGAELSFIVPCSSSRYDVFPVNADSSYGDGSFETACSKTSNDRENNNESFAVRSPIIGEFLYHMTEDYIHTDDECGVVFVERKIGAEPAGKS